MGVDCIGGLRETTEEVSIRLVTPLWGRDAFNKGDMRIDHSLRVGYLATCPTRRYGLSDLLPLRMFRTHRNGRNNLSESR